MRSVVFGILALSLIGASVGCIEQRPKATTTPEDPAGRAACFQNQQTIENIVQTKMVSEGLDIPRNYGEVKSRGFVEELLWCPAGGNMIWVPTEGGFMDCDVHGRWEDAQS